MNESKQYKIIFPSGMNGVSTQQIVTAPSPLDALKQMLGNSNQYKFIKTNYMMPNVVQVVNSKGQIHKYTVTPLKKWQVAINAYLHYNERFSPRVSEEEIRAQMYEWFQNSDSGLVILSDTYILDINNNHEVILSTHGYVYFLCYAENKDEALVRAEEQFCRNGTTGDYAVSDWRITDCKLA